jgi:hypothetical protein
MGTATRQDSAIRLDSLDGPHWVGIGAAFVTAAIHLLLGVRLVPSGLGVSFVLAGLGFLGAIVLVIVEYRRRAVYAVGIPFTAIQIVLWYYVNFAAGSKSFPADVGALGAADKLAQVVLIAVLIVLLRR